MQRIIMHMNTCRPMFASLASLGFPPCSTFALYIASIKNVDIIEMMRILMVISMFAIL